MSILNSTTMNMNMHVILLNVDLPTLDIHARLEEVDLMTGILLVWGEFLFCFS